jgi:uncharacterized protein
LRRYTKPMKLTRLLATCIGFQWDAGNDAKNWQRHDVTVGECEEVFFNKPLIVLRDQGHVEVESRYIALGRTHANRRLFVVFAVRHRHIRVISARDMTARESARYDS